MTPLLPASRSASQMISDEALAYQPSTPVETFVCTLIWAMIAATLVMGVLGFFRD